MTQEEAHEVKNKIVRNFDDICQLGVIWIVD